MKLSRLHDQNRRRRPWFQPASMKAKLAGLLIERTEVGAPGSFDNLCSIPSIADQVLEVLIEKFKPIDERIREALIAMYTRHIEEAQELIDAINARPITAETS